MPDKLPDFTSLIPRQSAGWKKMLNGFDADGIERIDIWGEYAPENPNGFKAGLYLLPVREGEARGTFIVCAGGAFLFKSANEGRCVAEFFRARGFNAAVLDYTVNPDMPDAARESAETRQAAGLDALRAIRYLRANAEKYGIRPDKIAIGGFSAGGITSQIASTCFDYGIPDADDPLMRVSSRPDAALLLYGAFSQTTSVGWLGYDAEKQNELAKCDPIRNIGCDCPPMFIFQTHMDDPRNALNFAMELAARGIPYEIHTFLHGPHGAGLYDGADGMPAFRHTAQWANLAGEWLEDQGF